MESDGQIKGIWQRDASDYVLHLGTMRKAVLVRLYSPDNIPDRMIYEHFWQLYTIWDKKVVYLCRTFVKISSSNISKLKKQAVRPAL